MAEGFAGISVRTGLPKNNGVAPLADVLVDDTTRPTVAIGVLHVEDVVYHVKADTRTAILRFAQIEASDLTDAEREQVIKILNAARERRTGQVPLPLDEVSDKVDDAPIEPAGGGHVEDADADAEAAEGEGDGGAGAAFSDADGAGPGADVRSIGGTGRNAAKKAAPGRRSGGRGRSGR